MLILREIPFLVMKFAFHTSSLFPNIKRSTWQQSFIIICSYSTHEDCAHFCHWHSAYPNGNKILIELIKCKYAFIRNTMKYLLRHLVLNYFR